MSVDPISASVISELIANALIGLFDYGINRRGKRIDKTKIKSTLTSDPKLFAILRHASNDLSQAISASPDKLKATLIELFLESPTAESIIRQVFSDSLPGIPQKSTQELKDEFRISLAYHLGAEPDTVGKLASVLFQMLSESCASAIQTAVTENLISGRDVASLARYKTILDELASLRTNMEFLAKNHRMDILGIKAFEKTYRDQADKRHSQITIPHWDRAPNVDIDRIFVTPNLITAPSKKTTSEPERIPFTDFVKSIHRHIVLGDPGGGKSTLSQKICHDLCQNYDERLLGGRRLTPVLVVLREYSEAKKKGLSIVEFMDLEATSKYQLSSKPPANSFEYLLHNGHLFVAFDGLDELLDPAFRREISRDIEAFCNLFPSVPVLITSRLVGYEKAPLNPEDFDTYLVAPFSDQQVSEYAKKWFKSDPEFSPSEGEKKAILFIKESDVASDLRSNPLMLALMCGLYRGAGYIPRFRPEVYMKCSEMLFERWDRSRGIEVSLSISESRVLLSHLARWIYSDVSLQNGVKEKALIREATKFLCPRRYEVEEEAERAATEFVEFCRGRAWVFTDVGTTASGQYLYKFTHKTFLEYFTAVDTIRNHSDAKKLWNFLRKKVLAREWDVIAQLAFQMLHERTEGASDQLLTLLLKDAEANSRGLWSYLSFGARCLQFIYPSPHVTRNLTETAISSILKGVGIPRNRRNLMLSEKEYPVEVIGALITAAQELRPIISGAIEETIVKYASTPDHGLVHRAIDLAETVDYPIWRGDVTRKSELESLQFWYNLQERIRHRLRKKIQKCAQHNLVMFNCWCLLMPSQPIVSLSMWYGIDDLFLPTECLVFKNIRSVAIATLLLEWFHDFPPSLVLRPDDIAKRRQWAIDTLSELWTLLTTRTPPYFNKEAASREHQELIDLLTVKREQESPQETFVQTPSSVSPAGVMGAWCIWAAASEAKGRDDIVLDRMKRAEDSLIRSLAAIIDARNLGVADEKVVSLYLKWNLRSDMTEFLNRWIRGDISLVNTQVSNPRNRAEKPSEK